MGFQLLDGTGSGKKAKIDSSNKLQVRSVIEPEFTEAAANGEAFFLGTPLVNLTNAAESAIFFCENNEDKDLIFENFFFVAEATTGGSPDMFRVSWYKNPTSISSPTATTPLNQNFGSSKELDVTLQYGAQGSTVTGGTNVALLSFPIGQFNNLQPARLVLKKGNSFALTVTPPTGNTSMDVQFGARTFLFTER